MIDQLQPCPVVTATPADDVRSVARKMRDAHVGCVVVVQDRRPVGIVTDRDLAVRVLAGDVPSHVAVSTVMTVDPTTVPVRASIDAALRAMRKAGVRRLPLVDDAGLLVGIVTHDDIFVSFARELGELGEGIESAVDSSELR